MCSSDLEPLVLSTPETRVEGSGAATHIRNRNEHGKPALILRQRFSAIRKLLLTTSSIGLPPAQTEKPATCWPF